MKINKDIWDSKYAAFKGETYEQGCKRVADALDVPELENILLQQKFSVGGRVWYGAGKSKPLMTNCALFSVSDSATGWANLLHDVTLALTSGMGIGVSYDKIRPHGSLIKGSGGTASGSVSLMEMVNEVARHIMQGNQRRSACYSSLHWKHGDIERFIEAKNWDSVQTYAKSVDTMYPATLDLTNISVRLDNDFFEKYNAGNERAVDIITRVIDTMFRTSEPGLQNDWDTQINRNGCCEVISRYSSDTCQLGSINLANIRHVDDLEDAIKYGMHALIVARLRSYYPTEEMQHVALNHPRVGLGVMGLHNWLIQRGLRYEWCNELEKLFDAIQAMAIYYGKVWTETYNLPDLEGHIAHAPTGSISRLFGGVSSGIEPIFALAYKWRYTLNAKVTETVVIDQNVEQFMRDGIDVSSIEDAYALASPDGFKRRVEMQAFIQKYCDNAISSTINLPQWGSEGNNENTLPIYRSILLAYMPYLRGITVYANGSRSGQPLTAIPINEALELGHHTTSEYSNCSSGACAL